MFLDKPYSNAGPPYRLNVDPSVLLGYADKRLMADLNDAVEWCDEQFLAETWGYDSNIGVFSFVEPWQQAAFRIRWG